MYLDVRVRLPLSSYYGPVEINRFGLWGAICDVGFNDKDAQVVCKQLNFNSGYALSTFATEGFPIIQGAVSCSGTEDSIASCDRGRFSEGHGCFGRDTVAGVMCFSDGMLTGQIIYILGYLSCFLNFTDFSPKF